MSDNKTKVTKQDAIRVDANDTSEVEYIHEQYPDMTHQQVKEAIQLKGPFRKDIIAYLDAKKN